MRTNHNNRGRIGPSVGKLLPRSILLAALVLGAVLLGGALAGCLDNARLAGGGAPGPAAPNPLNFITAGLNHSAALKSDGTLWAWGLNGQGQLGDNSIVDKVVPTQEFTAATDWVAIAAGASHTGALKSDGTLWGWGFNGNGRLGDNTTVNKLVPTQEFTGATDWVAIVAGTAHTVALKSDGTLWAWGLNSVGQFGDNTIVDKFVPTQEFTAATDWAAIAGANLHTLALKTDGTLWAWGIGTSGQLGDNTTVSKSVPTQEFTGATDWVAIAAGANHSLALKSNGTLWAWGVNGFGQLGDNSLIQRIVPTQEFTAATNWAAITGGDTHSVALKSDGTLWAWGTGTSGQLGDNTTVSKLVPTQEFTLATNWVAMAGGGGHSVALKSNGTIWAWGLNSSGQLGDNSIIQRNVPTQEFTAATDWGP